MEINVSMRYNIQANLIYLDGPWMIEALQS